VTVRALPLLVAALLGVGAAVAAGYLLAARDVEEG
jgi:hypothetical protein